MDFRTSLAWSTSPPRHFRFIRSAIKFSIIRALILSSYLTFSICETIWLYVRWFFTGIASPTGRMWFATAIFRWIFESTIRIIILSKNDVNHVRRCVEKWIADQASVLFEGNRPVTDHGVRFDSEIFTQKLLVVYSYWYAHICLFVGVFVCVWERVY
jgi:hypothetical protein